MHNRWTVAAPGFSGIASPLSQQELLVTKLNFPVLRSRRTLESRLIQSQRDSVTESIQKIVFTVALFVTHSKTLHLLEKVISKLAFVGHELVEGVIGILDAPLMNRAIAKSW